MCVPLFFPTWCTECQLFQMQQCGVFVMLNQAVSQTVLLNLSNAMCMICSA